ncbi:MAG: NAD(P)H-dependent oxidoreductase subunit E [Candidatus Eremiobacteraeota bacterium]|nr:NAD(P)H-dependent oxidoreductase subunit E [Candidatus Eremiobacteraeota bacterium]
MDLHFTSASATDAERAAVDAALDGARAARRDELRHLLLPVLHAINDRIGWISPGALNYACGRLEVAPAEAYGVATFYALFSTTPRAPRVVHVCDDIACMVAGVPEIDAKDGEIVRSPCLGLCDRAPAALVVEAGDPPRARQVAPADAALANGAPVRPAVGGAPLRLLQRVGRVDPESLDAYRASGGYAALRRALDIGPERIIEEVAASKLFGRGGAAFPTGRKMAAVASAPARPHYVVCNADESEPGTFKDRVLMEFDPFAVVEAMTIAAYAAGCERGFIYIRGEYPLATARLEHAIARSREARLLGDDVMGQGVRFDVELRRGAGAYICGEETALFNSIEGKRGEPRNKPPFPVEAGLFGKPTLINNVETLVNLQSIVLDGGAAYAAIGTPESAGTRLFCLSGAVAHPGVYEVPHGTPLGALIETAGGVPAPHPLRAILLGGAAGSMLAPDALSLPLSHEAARAAGATLGSGVVMLFDDRVDLAAILRRIARFFRDESCGQCVPCRVGTVRQEEAMARGDVVALDEIGRAMRDASICGLGQTAANVIASAGGNLEPWSS